MLAGIAGIAVKGVLDVAFAQGAYPTQPIRLILPYPPGAGADSTARTLGQIIIGALGQQVVVDSRPGAGATVGHGLAAKTQPGKLNFGSSGTGTPNHLGGELLMKVTGTTMLHVPSKGGGPMLTDLIAGQMHVGFLSLVQVMPHVRTGRLKVMGVGYTLRLKSAPDIATIAETVPGFNNTGWRGLAAPLGTPQPIIQKLNAVINKALATSAFIQYFVSNGLEPAGSTPAAFQELIATELQLWRKMIKDANISVNAL